FDPAVLQHDTGFYHPDTANRLEVVVEALRQDGRRIEAPPAPERTLKAVERVHDKAYVQRFSALCRNAPADYVGPFALFDCADNVISAGTFEASLRAVSLAIAATDLIEHHGVARVLVADFDVHHGNGVQDVFWDDGRVAYLSVHRYPF